MTAASHRSSGNAPSLVGRRTELHALLAAFRAREPRLVYGPPGAGKTELLAGAIARLPLLQRSRLLFPQPWVTPAELVAELLAQLVSMGDPVASARVGTVRRASARAQAATLTKALSASRYSIVLDPFAPASRPLARLLRHILTRAKTPVYITARTPSTADLGHAAGLYWCREMRIVLGPLASSSARELVTRETSSFPLAASELADLRSTVLRYGARMPGPMLEMCRLANDPRYHSHARMKLALLQIDAAVSTFPGAAPFPSQKGARQLVSRPSRHKSLHSRVTRDAGVAVK